MNTNNLHLAKNTSFNMNHTVLIKIYSALTFVSVLCVLISSSHCLYPVETLSREIRKLDGVWNFRICSQDDQDQGFREKWYNLSLQKVGEVIPMPVPSSFNDITQNKTIRDYLGWSWYETEFYVPQRIFDDENEVILRFGSAHYYAMVYVNGFLVMNHTGGHLPFEANITSFLSVRNRLTVALNNTLSYTTVPQGGKQFKSPLDGPYPPGYYAQTTNFDFFNYAGIHRSVLLYILPKNFISDLNLNIDVENRNGVVTFAIETNSDSSLNLKKYCETEILDKEGTVVAQLKNNCSGTIKVKNAILWWPYTMSDNPGYQYTLKVRATFITNDISQPSFDEYLQKFGFRTIQVTKGQFLVNSQPFYFTGFGKHEDSNIRGKGLDLPLIIKDFNLIKWVGANSFRTSHYPYAEELMDQADEQGIVVIDECPAVGLTSFTENILNQHLQILTELVTRDKYRPSVFAWSVANEPESSKAPAASYFSAIVYHVKTLDRSRPVTAALNQNYRTDKAGVYMDYIMYNHYYAWYSDMGATETITPLLLNDITEAYKAYGKPIMMSEYGADSIAGLHMNPSLAFTEDYQAELMARHHETFDILRQKGFFIGEHIWNFADFLTIQQQNRVVGNKKGIFTRERQPKAAAHILRCRYHKIAGKPLNDSSGYCPQATSSQKSLREKSHCY